MSVEGGMVVRCVGSRECCEVITEMENVETNNLLIAAVASLCKIIHQCMATRFGRGHNQTVSTFLAAKLGFLTKSLIVV